MTLPIPAAHARQKRRVRTVYGALRAAPSQRGSSSSRPSRGFMLGEMAALAALVLAAAGIIALRAVFAIG